VESGQACDNYKASCNVDIDGGTATLNVQALSLRWIKNNNLVSACKDINGKEETLIYGNVSLMT
jgi:hypothetical protein